MPAQNKDRDYDLKENLIMCKIKGCPFVALENADLCRPHVEGMIDKGLEEHRLMTTDEVREELKKRMTPERYADLVNIYVNSPVIEELLVEIKNLKAELEAKK